MGVFATPMDCKPPGFSIHGILQARILAWYLCPPPGDLPDPGIYAHLLCLLRWQVLYHLRSLLRSSMSSQHLNTAELSILVWIGNLKMLEATAILGLIPWWWQLAGSELQQPRDRACALQFTTPLDPKCRDCLRVRILPPHALMSQGQSVFWIVLLGLLKVIPIGKIMQGNCVCHLSNHVHS